MPNLKSWWRSLTLFRQFAVASSLMVLVGLGSLGLWVSHEIANGIKRHVGDRAGLYMKEFVAPLLQGLSLDQPLAHDTAMAIDQVFARDAPGLGVLVMKIWSLDGRLIYASDRKSVGEWFAPSKGLRRALEGRIDVEVEHAHGPHSGHGEPPGGSMEIYVPIFKAGSDSVLAAGEFYEKSNYLVGETVRAEQGNWIFVALVSFSLLAGLFTLVARGSRTIEAQRVSSGERIEHLSGLLKQNENLRERVQNASRRVAEGTELHLCRLGSDLHDGPVQLLALGLLKLDSVLDSVKASPKDREAIRSILSEAMAEMRDIAGGLAMPEVSSLALEEALKLIIAGHERRTLTRVAIDLPETPAPTELSHPVKLCLCRFVQEGLNNAFKHAKGINQQVTANWNDDLIIIEVADGGAGFDTTRPLDNRSALGLLGLRSRLESLGGHMTLSAEPGAGTRITATLGLQQMGQAL